MPLLTVVNKMFTPVGGGPKLGEAAAVAAFSPKHLKNNGFTTSGVYWLKNAGYN